MTRESFDGTDSTPGSQPAQLLLAVGPIYSAHLACGCVLRYIARREPADISPS